MKTVIVPFVLFGVAMCNGNLPAAALPVTENLVLWLDASDVDGAGNNPADGTSIGTAGTPWVNKATGSAVGSAFTATETSGTAPMYLAANASFNNLPTVYFDGTSSGLKIDHDPLLNATDGLTVFLVGSRVSGTGFLWMQKGSGGGGGAGDWFLSPHEGLGVAFRYTVYGLDTTPHVFEGAYDPDSGAYGGTLNLLDGSPRGAELFLTQTYTNPNTGPLYIGRRYNPSGSQGYVNGDIAEILVYNTNLSESEREAVGYYLQTKYGIPGSYVPEPSMALLLIMAALPLALQRRRLAVR
ncbi:MAG: hypothetical protein U1E05_07815 [Patescibacteria group bacterium]|nr:hypothetical protein [Patescibacteria group bacterium]